jgi:hypothetical protein
MKKVLILVMAVTFVLGLTAVSFADTASSAHNLTARIGATEICAVCHSPHDSGANRAANGPLWNHELSGLTFTMYQTDIIGNEAAPTEPGGTSRLCLGCHDGVTGLEAYGGVTTAVDVITGTKKIPDLNGTDGDLQGTHPISVQYVAAKSGLVSDITNNLLGIDPIENLLINGAIECSTCHDVHDNTAGGESTGTNMLRMTNAASALCLTCHVK